ncbi:MAG: arsenite methyltransferase [Candidatus Contendobacter sp.]|nr:arsenite methyltransferase [Candidatus Contendobacter sp.]
MTALNNDDIRQAVRERYARLAVSDEASCGCAPSCCGAPTPTPETMSQAIGYRPEELMAVPEGANLGLGCGNPQALAAMKPGETVIDLGSGAGFDVFLAARQVGESGRVIGVDMTPEMIAKARAHAQDGGFHNVEFRLGEIENLPVADGIADVVISNCVVNLSPDKPRVFTEVFRVLKPGGRLAIADVVARTTLPEQIRQNLAMYAGCMAGALLVSEMEAILAACGFIQIRVTSRDESRSFIQDWVPGTEIADYVVSATIEAVKPAI